MPNWQNTRLSAADWDKEVEHRTLQQRVDDRSRYVICIVCNQPTPRDSAGTTVRGEAVCGDSACRSEVIL